VYSMDDSGFPLLLVRWTGTSSKEDFAAFFEELERLHQRARTSNARLVTIHDARTAQRPDAPAREFAATRMKQATLDGSLLDVVVTDQAALRGVITAMSWVLPGQMKKVKSTATLQEAYALANQIYVDAKLPLPQRPRWAS
jgi:hypothetical protein